MNDEIELVAQIRPDVEPYDADAKIAARARLRTSRRKAYRIVLAGALAVGAVAATTVVAMNRPEREATPVVVAMPKMAKMSAEELLGRAAGQAAGDDLRPRADQYIEVSSQVMYSATAVSSGETSRYLYRNNRTIWQSADGSRAGVLQSEGLEPKAYPGWPVPDHAWDNVGDVSLMKLSKCEAGPLWYRYDYVSLSQWPDDVTGMRAFLYNEGRNGNGPDQAAWTAVGDILRENYVPPAQRAALFKAAATIPGVTVNENAQDAAGRHGLGAGREFLGIRQEIVFDATTYELLGERQVVVDAEQAKAPVGSVLASTAQLEVKITDTVPAVADDPGLVCPEPASSPAPATDSSKSPTTEPSSPSPS
ncbi:hypothetical protein Aple_102300 [Acrocarpospora pleiomorpha]|uniref:Uncharacterized protein n=1 Tax=Acrocarpospora pleiomorpha TaxID=90975 RepID=A0A5M3Y235_9ACTN|nr:CU044_5270 family protein [Acrocarpospora pleiomorpha]GES27330.1 hypothetical protein Aple_102300 [Acrocarpospora pleiomorpha]